VWRSSPFRPDSGGKHFESRLVVLPDSGRRQNTLLEADPVFADFELPTPNAFYTEPRHLGLDNRQARTIVSGQEQDLCFSRVHQGVISPGFGPAAQYAAYLRHNQSPECVPAWSVEHLGDRHEHFSLHRVRLRPRPARHAEHAAYNDHFCLAGQILE